MVTDLAPVTPSVLRWARTSVGVSLVAAARRAGVAPERVELWESGDAQPTLAKLRALGQLYQRPISIFFLPEPPRDFDSLKDFRRLPASAPREMSPALHKLHRRAAEQQEIAEELLSDEGEIPPVNLGAASVKETSTEEAARDLRSRLGISMETQFAWAKPEQAFAAWLEAAESLGVLVMRTSDVDSNEMRGFSITGTVPVVVVNALDWPRGQVFTLIHEVAHLMLREGGVCNLLDDPSHHGRIEQWCNAVAADTLMPRDEFVETVGRRPDEPTSDWSDGTIELLSAQWSVSQESVARRLVTLGFAPTSFYDVKREQYTAAYRDLREAERQRRRERERQGGPPPARMTARDRGKPYVRLVLDAYHRNELSASSTSSILGLKVRHLRDLEREVRA